MKTIGEQSPLGSDKPMVALGAELVVAASKPNVPYFAPFRFADRHNPHTSRRRQALPSPPASNRREANSTRVPQPQKFDCGRLVLTQSGRYAKYAAFYLAGPVSRAFSAAVSRKKQFATALSPCAIP